MLARARPAELARIPRIRAEASHLALASTRAEHDPQRRDCLAGHVRFELRNVVANYPFERSHGFPGIKPNSGHQDYSRLSCGVEDTQTFSLRAAVCLGA